MAARDRLNHQPPPIRWAARNRIHAVGNEVPAGTDGEVEIRRPGVLPRKYLDESPDEATAFTKDGWTRTGDIGRIGEDGGLVVVDRKKDVIIVGGRNVASSEIERVLENHSGIDEASVIGGKHPRLGEVPLAAIVPSCDLTEREIFEFARTQLSLYKVPRTYLFLESLPRNRLGKVDKNAIRSLFSAQDAGRQTDGPSPGNVDTNER